MATHRAAELEARLADVEEREKAIKAWKRLWKIQLVEAANSTWRDLYPDIL